MYLKASRCFMELAEKQKAGSENQKLAAGLLSLTEAIESDLEEIKARLAVLEAGQEHMAPIAKPDRYDAD